MLPDRDLSYTISACNLDCMDIVDHDMNVCKSHHLLQVFRKKVFQTVVLFSFYPPPKAEGYRFVHVRPSVRPEPLLSNR